MTKIPPSNQCSFKSYSHSNSPKSMLLIEKPYYRADDVNDDLEDFCSNDYFAILLKF